MQDTKDIAVCGLLVGFVHIRREGNQVADSLAKHSLSLQVENAFFFFCKLLYRELERRIGVIH